MRIQPALVILVAGCATGTSAPVPVIPAIHDHTIVIGQRVGPISLGMSESQLADAVGKPTTEQSYGGNRRGLTFTELKIHTVVDTGRVVFVSPLDASYTTTTGLRVGAREEDVRPVLAPASRRDRNGTISYCFADRTLVTVSGEGASMPANVCARGQVCDIAIGGCEP